MSLLTFTRRATDDDDAAPDLEPAADAPAPALTPDGWPAFAEQRRPGHFAATWTINVVTNAAVTAAVADRLRAAADGVARAEADALASEAGVAWRAAADRLRQHRAELAAATRSAVELPARIADALTAGQDPAGLEAELAAVRADHARLAERSQTFEQAEAVAAKRYQGVRATGERNARSASYGAAARALEDAKERLRAAVAEPLAEVFVAQRVVNSMNRALGLK